MSVPGQVSPLLAVIVPVHNAAAYLRACLLSVTAQRDVPLHRVELLIYDDASTDESIKVALDVQPHLCSVLHRVEILHDRNNNNANPAKPLGCGGARNRACAQATAPILVFQDADDVMLPLRLSRTLAALLPTTDIDINSDTNSSGANDSGTDSTATKCDVIGGSFERLPAGSTPRYEAYHARLVDSDDLFFATAFRDAPLPMPTVACGTHVWRACPFVSGVGVPEDLHFQYGAMQAGFRLYKLPGPPVVQYRFHDEMASLSLSRRTLLRVRVTAFETLVLSRHPAWKDGFSIWNAGRDGKDVFNMLSDAAKQIVRAWGDVNPRKIGLRIKNIPVIHFSQLKPPIACCVPLDRDGREFEANLAALQLRPGHDYVHLI